MEQSLAYSRGLCPVCKQGCDRISDIDGTTAPPNTSHHSTVQQHSTAQHKTVQHTAQHSTTQHNTTQDNTPLLQVRWSAQIRSTPPVLHLRLPCPLPATTATVDPKPATTAAIDPKPATDRPSSASQWACSQCTFCNQASDDDCELCKHPRLPMSPTR